MPASPMEQTANRVTRLNVKRLFFSLFVIPGLGIIYFVVVAQGLRISLPILGTKLYSLPIPGFSYMRHYENTRALDLAHVLSILVLQAVAVLSVALLEMVLLGVRAGEQVNIKHYKRVLCCLSVVIIGTDIVMFYRGIADQGGFLDAADGLTPLIATIAYTGLLAFVACGHVLLKHKIV